jgi:hypothetical protein
MSRAFNGKVVAVAPVVTSSSTFDRPEAVSPVVVWSTISKLPKQVCYWESCISLNSKDGHGIVYDESNDV